MSAPAQLADGFSPGAIRLNARALGAACHARGRVAVALDAGGPSDDELRALRGMPTSELVERSSSGAREIVLECERAELAALATELPCARILLDAVRAVERAPREPALMGVVNVTPDSFSDGGLYLDPAEAIEHGLRLAADGAALLDVGGESTRPGARPVSVAEELERVLPVVEGLAARSSARISIDTRKHVVARAALDAGATLVNDVSAGTHDPRMLPLIAARGVDYVAMHAQGDPGSMQAGPTYADPVADVARALRERLAAAWNAGVEPSRIILDPGIGFGKRLEHNLALLRRLPELRSLGRPLLLGVSRKSFIGHLSGAEKQEDWKAGERRDRPASRLGGTAAAVTACVLGGAEILRVHDVRVMAEAVRVARALARPDFESS